MLIMDPAQLDRIADHARQGYPEEVCGLLVGLEDQTASQRTVREVHPVANIHHERARDRFELDPRQHLRIQRQARQRGFRIVGVYHSHPDHPAEPSETDHARAVAIWQDSPSWSYLIVPVGAAGAEPPRSWVLQNARFVEETIETGSEA